MLKKLLTLVLVLSLLVGTVFSAFPAAASTTETKSSTSVASPEDSILATQKIIDTPKATWSYLADGTDPGANLATLNGWTTADYNDEAWTSASAPFGCKKDTLQSSIFGQKTPSTLLPLKNDAGKSILTYYFRKTIEITSLEGYNALYFDIAMDDAVVLYINGTVVFNSCVDSSSAATTNYYISDGTVQQKQFRVYLNDYPGLVKEGKNVIAVELHSGKSSASSTYFVMNKLYLQRYEKVPYAAEAVAMTPGANETQKNLAWLSNIEEGGEVRLAKKSEVVKGVFPSEYTAFSASSAPAAVAFEKYAKAATITGLEENTEYAYVIVADGTSSKIYYFSTGSFDTFDFVFVGDPQLNSDDGEAWEDSLEKITNNFSPDFIISAGDQITSPDAEELYSLFINEYLSGTALAPTVGPGHESPTSAYGDHYNLPNYSDKYGANETSANYWYSYGNTLFMHLNMSDAEAASNGEHEAFLKEAIAQNPDATWKIVVMHQSLFSTGNHANDSPILNYRLALIPVFDELGINMVLSGHDHVYVRTKVLDGTTPTNDLVIDNTVICPSGVIYLCASSSTGSKFYPQSVENDPTVAVENYEYRKSAVRFIVTDTSLTFTTYFLDDMSVIDTLTIKNTNDSLTENVMVVGTSVTLDEMIDMNVYIATAPEFTGIATLSCGNKSVDFDLSTLTTDENGRYKLSIALTSIEIAKPVVLTVDGASCETSVKEYLEKLIAINETTYYTNVAKALLNYGAYAQEYFAEQNADPSLLDVLANESLAESDKVLPALTADDLAAYKFSAQGTTEDVRFLKVALVLASQTGIKLYFTASENATVTVDGVEYEKQSERGMYYVIMTVPSPAYATGAFNVTITDGDTVATTSFSAYTAIHAALYNAGTDPKLVSLLKAYAAYCASTLYTGYDIDYRTNGGTLPKDAPTTGDPSAPVTLPEATMKGYAFAGWYTTSDFKNGTRISKIPAGNTEKITLYARYMKSVIDFDLNDPAWNDVSVDLNDASANLQFQNANKKNIITLSTNGQTGATIKTETNEETGDKYLLFSDSNTNAPSMILHCSSYGYKQLSSGVDCVSFTFEISYDATAPMSTQFLLRSNYDVTGTAAKVKNIIVFLDKEGNVSLVDNGKTVGEKITTLKDGETTTLRFVIDFGSLELRAYDEDGNVIATGALSIPSATKATTGAEYMQCFAQDILRIEGQVNKDKAAALRFHSIKVAENDIFAFRNTPSKTVIDLDFEGQDFTCDDTTEHYNVMDSSGSAVAQIRTKGQTGASAKTVTDENGDTYLLLAEGTKVPAVMLFCEQGGYTNLTTGVHCLSFTFKISYTGDAPMGVYFQLRANKDKDGNSIDTHSNTIVYLDSDGNVNFIKGSEIGEKITKLQKGETTTLRFVVDFEKEELRAYDEDGNVIAEGDLYLPAATNATTGLEYMQCMTSNIMRLNGASNKDEEATLCLYYINVSERDIFAN